MNRTRKRVVVISDLHSGHRVGLTPPGWQYKPKPVGGKFRTKQPKWLQIQEELWRNYEEIIRSLQPIHILVVNGDAVDGRQAKNGGTEGITVDPYEQSEMASYSISICKAKKIIMTYGTPYHTGEIIDYENILADMVGAEKIGAHEWIDVNGVVFDIKHHCGGSTIPHGRHTAIARERLWNVLYNDQGEQARADVLIRSHVHYHQYCGTPEFLAMTTPALQGMGSKFGSRRCSGTVDWGVVWFDVDKEGGYSWHRRIVRITAQKQGALKL